jgi:hypothetical protein
MGDVDEPIFKTGPPLDHFLASCHGFFFSFAPLSFCLFYSQPRGSAWPFGNADIAVCLKEEPCLAEEELNLLVALIVALWTDRADAVVLSKASKWLLPR